MNDAEQLDADFRSHRIEGFARAAQEAGKPAEFDCPLITQVEGNLWVGGVRWVDRVELPEFEFVVALYQKERYRLMPEQVRLDAQLLDAQEIPSPKRLYDLARIANAFSSSGKTLVHCQAGLNRSSLVVALALMIRRPVFYEPAEAIALLRKLRSPQVLCNETFERWLLAGAPIEVCPTCRNTGKIPREGKRALVCRRCNLGRTDKRPA